MKNKALKEIFISNAEEIQRLRAHRNETWRDPCKTPEQRRRAFSEYCDRYDELAFPGGASSAIARVASGDSEAIEAALCFVEARPFFFRSGYMFKAFLQKLKRAKLSPSQSKRFGRVLSAYALWREQKKVKQAITSHNKPLDAGRAERRRA
jgi:hypothetical protein